MAATVGYVAGLLDVVMHQLPWDGVLVASDDAVCGAVQMRQPAIRYRLSTRCTVAGFRPSR
ncbi:hypothetical protein ADK38_37480 [Streptomyces varsoviensis]|uniref:Uncharacterized protein n=1 Tax=Streptomyces varsoviensis TaxID=67373 RepID=A0ABR5IVW1_9ACTN|nr:hypothetical protein ADK38_37480 [Streptomyces varsoviensis]